MWVSGHGTLIEPRCGPRNQRLVGRPCLSCTGMRFASGLTLEIFMKSAFPKGRKPRELKKTKRAPKRPPVAETIAERYFEVLRLRQRVLEADTWRLGRH